jgi:AcrR family transcriptional regulator
VIPQNPTAERIAAVALRIIEEYGATAVTMRRVAHDVGVTPMAIYHHFSDRDVLLTAVADREFDAMVSMIDAARPIGRSSCRLLSVMDYYLDYAFARPKLFDYLFSRPRPDARRFPDDFRARRSPTLKRVADAVAACMQRGEIMKDDIWEVAFELWAHAHGYVSLFRAGRFAMSEPEFRSLYRRSLRRLLNGLTSKKLPDYTRPDSRNGIRSGDVRGRGRADGVHANERVAKADAPVQGRARRRTKKELAS